MFKNAVELFEVFGFKIKLDPSWVLIAGLIVWSLSVGYFPRELEGYSVQAHVILATFSMLALFASLILHELSHSLVARQFGLSVGGITLFIFGGVAELEQEPQNPKSEFWIAIAGPAMSLVLGVIAILFAAALERQGDPQPIVVVLNYLGFINIVIAVFNLVPAFPLDGGRVLRAVIWYLTNNLLRATQVASAIGTAFGFLLILSGLYSVFASQTVGGLWQILIGFFILSTSKASYQQLLINDSLKNQTVEASMTTNPHTARADDTVQTLVDDVMFRHNVNFVPVVDGAQLLGYVDKSLVQGVRREDWPLIKVADVLAVSTDENTVSPSVPMATLFETMAKSGRRKFLVAEQSELKGVISLPDIVSFLDLRQSLRPSIENSAGPISEATNGRRS